jgi:hypothetical protein
MVSTMRHDPLPAHRDRAAVRARPRAAWSPGDDPVNGTTVQIEIIGETLCEVLDIRAGASVLDVAAAIGNASPAPALCGMHARIAEPFDPHALSIASGHRWFAFGYRSREPQADVFKALHGPLVPRSPSFEPPAQSTLRRDLTSLLEQLDTGGDGSMVVPSAYFEAVITLN